MSEYILSPEWQEGIPSKLVDLVIIDYMDDYEFGMYIHSRGEWFVYHDNEWKPAQEEIKGWHYLAPRQIG